MLQNAEGYGVDPRFRVVPDEFGESRSISAALDRVSEDDLIAYDNPEYRDIRLLNRKLMTTVDLELLPGGRALFEQLAITFVESYGQHPQGNIATAV